MGEREPYQVIYERLQRARLFYALILVKIGVRRVPFFQKEWTATTTRLIEQASQVLKNKGFQLS